MPATTTTWCGQSVERVEDSALLTGRGRFIDDLGVRPGTLHAAILRSPHAHARISAVRTEASVAEAASMRSWVASTLACATWTLGSGAGVAIAAPASGPTSRPAEAAMARRTQMGDRRGMQNGYRQIPASS